LPLQSAGGSNYCSGAGKTEGKGSPASVDAIYAAGEAFLAVFSNKRSASFTESASGNAAATSGASVTITVPCGKRLVKRPRTALEKSYSGRTSASLLRRSFVLFILSPFLWSCPSCADESDRFLVIGMNHNQKQLMQGTPKSDPAFLVLRMLQVGHHKQEGIKEYCGRFLEVDSMLGLVDSGLCRIPDD
jgi:hypothetical protein